MNLQDITNEELLALTEKECLFYSCINDEISELRRRLCAVKSPFQVRYKFLPNDVELEKCPEITVRAMSPRNAVQVLLDANFDWPDQDMVFAVVPVGQSWWTAKHFTVADLE
jgi:hypothetical protein